MPSLCRCSMAAATSWLRLNTTEGWGNEVPGRRGSPMRRSSASLRVPCSQKEGEERGCENGF
jgi:hypothetical protein